jgi:hypothetical protein
VIVTGVAANGGELCVADWAGAGDVWDLSGNVEEWTLSEVGSTGLRTIRGGSYKTVAGGMTCGYDFFSGPEAGFGMDQLGFRCCKGTAGTGNPIDECEMAINTIESHLYDFNAVGGVCKLSGWTLFGGWEIGHAADSDHPPADSSCHIATNLDGDYYSCGGSGCNAVSPWIDLTGCETDGVTLHYSMYYDLFINDRFYVEIYDGDSWETLASETIANEEAAVGWTNYTVSLGTVYISNMFRIRFRLDDNDSNEPGVWMDNIYLTAN